MRRFEETAEKERTQRAKRRGAARMGCGKSKAASAPTSLPAGQRVTFGANAVQAEQNLISSSSDGAAAIATPGRGRGGVGAESLRDRPALQTTAEAAVVGGRAASGTGGSGEGSGAAIQSGKHASASWDLPANRSTLPPVKLRGGKPADFASMVPTFEARLELSLEDVTGPIDPQQVQKPPTPRTALSPGVTLVSVLDA